jgi:hypothetical protein
MLLAMRADKRSPPKDYGAPGAAGQTNDSATQYVGLLRLQGEICARHNKKEAKEKPVLGRSFV